MLIGLQAEWVSVIHRVQYLQLQEGVKAMLGTEGKEGEIWSILWGWHSTLGLCSYMWLQKRLSQPRSPMKWRGSPMTRLQCETTSSSTTIPVQSHCQPCSYPSTQTYSLLPLRGEVLLQPRPGTEPGWQKKPAKTPTGMCSKGTCRWVNVTKKVALRDHLVPALASQKG